MALSSAINSSAWAIFRLLVRAEAFCWRASGAWPAYVGRQKHDLGESFRSMCSMCCGPISAAECFKRRQRAKAAHREKSEGKKGDRQSDTIICACPDKRSVATITPSRKSASQRTPDKAVRLPCQRAHTHTRTAARWPHEESTFLSPSQYQHILPVSLCINWILLLCASCGRTRKKWNRPHDSKFELLRQFSMLSKNNGQQKQQN